MRQPSWRQWLVLSVLGAAPALGCNHAAHECNCASTVRPMSSVVVLPTPAPETTVARLPKPDPVLETVVAKKPVPPTGTVAVPMVIGSTSGSNRGTIELTAEDAEAMGVKPGYTPGAIFMPPKPE
jgi:hypothetical protein